MLTEADIYVLEHIDRDVLKASISFLKGYSEVLWKDNDTGDIVTLKELHKRRLRHQPEPMYPPELRRMGKMFLDIFMRGEGIRLNLGKEGVFTKGSFETLCTGSMWSAALIANVICDAFVRERYADGLFGFGVEDNVYLKMLLRLDDLLIYYDYMKAHEGEKEPGGQ